MEMLTSNLRELLYESIEAAADNDLDQLLEAIIRWSQHSSDGEVTEGIGFVLGAVNVGLREQLSEPTLDEETAAIIAGRLDEGLLQPLADVGVGEAPLVELLKRVSLPPVVVDLTSDDALSETLTLGLLALTAILSLPSIHAGETSDDESGLQMHQDSILLGGTTDPLARLTVLLALMGYDDGSIEWVDSPDD